MSRFDDLPPALDRTAAEAPCGGSMVVRPMPARRFAEGAEPKPPGVVLELLGPGWAFSITASDADELAAALVKVAFNARTLPVEERWKRWAHAPAAVAIGDLAVGPDFGAVEKLQTELDAKKGGGE